MSVMSMSLNYLEVCGKSHEFLRRGCSYTPVGYAWAGDILITSDVMIKQSEVDDMRGGAADVNHLYESVNSACQDKEVGIPSQYKVEETDIRNGTGTFNYLIEKAANPENETQWDLGVYQSVNDCGVLMDGGDALQYPGVGSRVTSLCGTIDRDAGVSAPKAHYLDNRKSYQDDPDNGLLVAIRTGVVHRWEIRYAPKERNLSSGLVMSDDVTAQFMEQVAALGMGHEDIFEFGMI